MLLWKRYQDEPRDCGGVVKLFKCLVKLESDELSQSFVQALCSKPKAFPVLTKLVPACQELHKSISEEKGESFQQLVFYCIGSLIRSRMLRCLTIMYPVTRAPKSPRTEL